MSEGQRDRTSKTLPGMEYFNFWVTRRWNVVRDLAQLA